MTNKIRSKDRKFDDVFIKGTCPYCGSGPVDPKDDNSEGQQYTEVLQCDECGKIWWVEYTPMFLFLQDDDDHYYQNSSWTHFSEEFKED